MTKKTKQGRPKLPKKEVRTSRLICRVTKAELTAIEAAASDSGKTTSEWVRKVVLAKAGSGKNTRV